MHITNAAVHVLFVCTNFFRGLNTCKIKYYFASIIINVFYIYLKFLYVVETKKAIVLRLIDLLVVF